MKWGSRFWWLVCVSGIAQEERSLSNPRFRVNVVAFGTSGPSGIASLKILGPIYAMAVDELNRRYNSTMEFVYFQSPARSCLMVADTKDEVLARWYYVLQRPSSVTVFVTGSEIGCAASDLSVYTLIATWNSLLINTMSGIEINKNLPTALSLTYVCSACLVTFAIKVIDYYNWRSVYILVDVNSQPNFVFIGRGLAERILRDGRRIRILHEFTSTVSTSYTEILTNFRNGITRVIFIFAHADKLRKVLIAANSLNMTDGSYICIALEIVPFAYGTMSWKYDDKDDQIAKDAFRSLLVLQPLRSSQEPNKFSHELAQEFQKRSREQFNITYPIFGLIPFLTSSYSAILIMGEVLQAAILDKRSLLNGQMLRDEFSNHTFASEFGNIYISNNGVREEDLVISHYNIKIDEKEPFLIEYANASNRNLSQIGPVNDWPAPYEWPPPGVASCRVKGNCTRPEFTWNMYVGIGACLLIVLISGAVIAFRYYEKRDLIFRQWWILSSTWLLLKGI